MDKNEFQLNKISIKIPVDEKKLKNALGKSDFRKIMKLQTINTYNASFRFGRVPIMALVMKKKDIVKIIYRNPFYLVGEELENGLRQYLSEIISVLGLKKNIATLIKENYPNVLQEWQLKDIECWINLFGDRQAF